MMMTLVILEERGGICLARSAKLAQMFRDAAAGLRDAEVEEMTGLSFATWQRMKSGLIVSDAKIIQFCNGLGLDAAQFLAAANEARPSVDTPKLIASILSREGLSRTSIMKLLTLYRQLAEEDSHVNSNAA